MPFQKNAMSTKIVLKSFFKSQTFLTESLHLAQKSKVNHSGPLCYALSGSRELSAPE